MCDQKHNSLDSQSCYSLVKTQTFSRNPICNQPWTLYTWFMLADIVLTSCFCSPPPLNSSRSKNKRDAMFTSGREDTHTHAVFSQCLLERKLQGLDLTMEVWYKDWYHSWSLIKISFNDMINTSEPRVPQCVCSCRRDRWPANVDESFVLVCTQNNFSHRITLDLFV